jgi:type IV secretion system protein VirB8
MNADSQTDAFIDPAMDWETDEILRARKHVRLSLLLGVCGMLTGLAGCLAVAFLSPLKSVEPIVIRVDKTTGSADIITRVDERTVVYNEVLDKYWLSRYVNYREEYSNADAYPYYQAVSLMSSRQVGEAYFAQINPRNPRAPVNVYAKDGLVDVTVNSITFLGANNVSQVRFTRTERGPNTAAKETHWIATIAYQYLASPMKEHDRLINPTGFQVTEYRLDSETVATGG